MGRENPEPVTRRAPPPIEARLGWLGIAFAALYLASVYIKIPVLRPGVTLGDLIDVATPFVLIVLYALVGQALFVGSPGDRPDSPGILHFGPRMLLAAGGFALVLGHGMHVAANSIHDAITRARVSDPSGLVAWWDERVSHYIIDSSKVVIATSLTLLERRSHAPSEAASKGESRPGLLAIGATAYGFIYFAAAVEGRTVPLLLPFCVAYLVWGLTHGRPIAPVRRFFSVGAAVSVLLFAVWGVWHRGFPEFSAVGMIPQNGP